MWYCTTFTGQLKFPTDMTIPCLTLVKSFLGKDCREHPEWGHPELTYIDLTLTDDLSGLEWDWSEKTYDLPEKINLIITEVRKHYPNFTLTGQLNAQGEDFDDRWILEFASDGSGLAVSTPLVISGKVIKCPHCDEKFQLEE